MINYCFSPLVWPSFILYISTLFILFRFKDFFPFLPSSLFNFYSEDRLLWFNPPIPCCSLHLSPLLFLAYWLWKQKHVSSSPSYTQELIEKLKKLLKWNQWENNRVSSKNEKTKGPSYYFVAFLEAKLLWTEECKCEEEGSVLSLFSNKSLAIWHINYYKFHKCLKIRISQGSYPFFIASGPSPSKYGTVKVKVCLLQSITATSKGWLIRISNPLSSKLWGQTSQQPTFSAQLTKNQHLESNSPS